MPTTSTTLWSDDYLFSAHLLFDAPAGTRHPAPSHIWHLTNHFRAAIAEMHLLLTPNGNVHYQLKTPYRYGTAHVFFKPLDFIARHSAGWITHPVTSSELLAQFA